MIWTLGWIGVHTFGFELCILGAISNHYIGNDTNIEGSYKRATIRANLERENGTLIREGYKGRDELT